MPKVSVILPTYNCEQYIKATMDSLINQTFSDFEILIVDDCSTDSTVEIIKQYSDPRILLTIKEKNSGYTDSLNWAIARANGKYIARMDGDDICHLERFEKQSEYLDTHPEIVLLGTNAQVIDSDFCFNYPSQVEPMMSTLLFGNTFVHPSVMGRAEVFKKYPYDKNREPAEDYDLWTRIINEGKVTNLPEVLLYYRVHDGQISNLKKDKQDSSARKSMLRMFQLLSYDRKRFSEDLILNAIWPHRNIELSELKKAITWFDSLVDDQNKFDVKLLKKALHRKRYNLFKYYASRPSEIDAPIQLKMLFLRSFPKLATTFYIKSK